MDAGGGLEEEKQMDTDVTIGQTKSSRGGGVAHKQAESVCVGSHA